MDVVCWVTSQVRMESQQLVTKSLTHFISLMYHSSIIWFSDCCQSLLLGHITSLCPFQVAHPDIEKGPGVAYDQD
jgi:hypothetical protein